MKRINKSYSYKSSFNYSNINLHKNVRVYTKLDVSILNKDIEFLQFNKINEIEF